ncbi:MAG: dTMP kinase [Firmicutes bacterium]|nr:dTMP kinase [Bacillota bacterium]
MANSEKQGIFIALEGCEGVGKSTQLALLKEYMQKTNQSAVFTREPGGTELAEKIRGLLLNEGETVPPLVEAYLFATARADHFFSKILPLLNEGKTVITDRFIASSLAYQGKARGLGLSTVLEINKFALNRMPDITIFLDMNPLNSWRKQSGTTVSGDRMEQEADSFHSLVYQGFKELAQNDKSIVEIVPCNNKNETFEKILSALRERGAVK